MSLVDYQSSSEESDDDRSKPDENPETLPNKISTEQKRKEPVKIKIPSLNEFQAEGEEHSKKPKLKVSSGLLSMLPAPKHSSTGRSATLVPPSVKRKGIGNNNLPNVSVLSTTVRKTDQVKRIEKDKMVSQKIGADTTEVEIKQDNSGVLPSDFFSLNSKPETITISSTLQNLKNNEKCGWDSPLHDLNVDDVSLHPENDDSSDHVYSSSSYNPIINNSELSSVNSQSSYSTTISESQFLQPSEQLAEASVFTETIPTDVIHDERFLRLQGKRKKGLDDINIVDVSVDNQLADKNQWLTKSISEEKKVSFSRKKGELPTQQQRRKHQITYLAFQAKERELDLKNQWAQNRLTKRETQSKYGF